MNERLTLQDLIELLSKKQNKTKKETELFLRELFALITETIEKNDSVKIKEFGTFKLVKVNVRKSVDVNTGEDIEIPAHFKLSFTPDKSLKESVNRPFAHFETVILEDGVTFENEEALEEEEKKDVVESQIDHDQFVQDEVVDIPTPVEISIDEKEEPQIDDQPTDEEEVSDNETLAILDETQVEKADEQELVTESEPVDEEVTQPKEEIQETNPIKLKTFYTPKALKEMNESGGKDVQSVSATKNTTDDILHKPTTQGKTIGDNLEEEIRMAKQEYIDSIRRKSESLVDSEENDIDSKAPEKRVVEIESEMETETPEPVVVKQPEPVVESEQKYDDDDLYEEDYEYSDKKRNIIIITVVVAFAALFFLGSAYFSDIKRFFGISEPITVDIQKPITDSIANDSTAMVSPIDTVIPKEDIQSVKGGGKEPQSIKETGKTTTATTSGKTDKVSNKGNQDKSKSRVIDNVTIEKGHTLRNISLKYYGNKSFWVYIYEMNKGKIKNPNNVPLGTKLAIPSLKNYGVDPKDPQDIEKAKKAEQELFKTLK